MLTTKSTLYAMRKDKRDTKEDVGKSRRMHSAYIGLTKGASWAEVTKNQACNLSHCRVMLV